MPMVDCYKLLLMQQASLVRFFSSASVRLVRLVRLVQRCVCGEPLSAVTIRPGMTVQFEACGPR